jgi:hypothetical protein
MTGIQGHILLSDMANAVGQVAVLQRHLPATQVRIAAGLGRLSLTSLRVTTPDEAGARWLAGALRLDDDRESHHDAPVWSGRPVFPRGSEPSLPVLRVDLAVTSEPSEPTSTLHEIYDSLSFLHRVVVMEIPVVLVHLRVRDGEPAEVEIHTVDRRGAEALRLELAGLELPVQAVVLATTT